MIRLATVLVVALVGCTETIKLGSDPLSGLIAIAIEPPHATLAIDDLTAPPQTIDYVALGSFADGSIRDITANVEWTVDNPFPVEIVGDGRYQTSQAAAGHVLITARANELEAMASLTVTARITITDPLFPPPAGAEELFTPAIPVAVGHPSRSPALLYPSDATRFPQELARILFQIDPATGNDVYRLVFLSDVLEVVVLTAGDRWLPDEPIWTLLGRSHPGSAMQLTVQALSSEAPSTIYASPPALLSFSRVPVDAAMTYWTGATNSIVRAELDQTSVAKLYPAGSDRKCVGCHTIARDGSRMALGYDGEKLRSVRLDDLATEIGGGSPMGWAAFSPTGDRIVIADKGTLTLRDAITGQPIGPDNGRIALPMKATHPDWSPDGNYLAVALSSDVTNMDVKAASIARIRYVEGTWGPVEILVASDGTSNNYFPRWSPDGRYLAFVHATEPSRGAGSAELRIVAADGGTAIALRLASHRVRGTDNVPGLANTMPAWSPMVVDGSAWLAFASIRPYGLIRPTTGPSQIWITGVDLSRADVGTDPSFAAFWLPAQDIRVLNNNPIWAPRRATASR